MPEDETGSARGPGEPTEGSTRDVLQLPEHVPATSAAYQALERALERMSRFIPRAPNPPALAACLLGIRQSVHGLMSGTVNELAPVDVVHDGWAVRVVQRVRRLFIDEVGHGADHDAHSTVAVLIALDRIERELYGDGSEDIDDLDSVDRAAFELSLEVAHDMRSPLTAILFLLDMLRSGRSGALSPGQAKQLGIIYGAAFGLSQMVSDVVDHARAIDRQALPHPVPFSITDVLNSVRDILLPVIGERELDIVVSSITDDARVGLPDVLHRIVLNLATNAVKFTPAGRVTLAAAAQGGTRVRFSVSDTGPGLSEQTETQLFHAFRHAPTGRHVSFSSSGLGLAISEQLVRALGSELQANSSPGAGTRFEFLLDLPHSSR